jgi:hypothetical protein
MMGQSESSPIVQFGAQQPSLEMQETMGEKVHMEAHSSGFPESSSEVHGLPSSQAVGQFSGGSQVSPSLTTPSPHWIGQSESFPILHSAGQQPSPEVQASTDACSHSV